jgi:hypothetical protein
MKISLRTARKLETKIGKYLDENQVNTTVKVRVNTPADKLTSVLDTARQETRNSFADQMSLASARYDIRNSISKRNAASDIDNLISRKVSAENSIKQLKSILSAEARLDQDALGDTIKLGQKRFEQAAPDQYGSRDNPVVTSLSVLTQSDLDEYKSQVTKLQRSVEENENALDALNHTEQVELSPDAVNLLRKHQLL